jgi:hypothetical protein
MTKLLVTAGLLLMTFEGLAMCTPDPAELGDIGPEGELVCTDLERRFPDSIMAVENRTIRSPCKVEILVSVDNKTMVLDYELAGFTWELDSRDEGFAEIATRR